MSNFILQKQLVKIEVGRLRISDEIWGRKNYSLRLLNRAYLPEREHQTVLTDIHPFKWLSIKFVS